MEQSARLLSDWCILITAPTRESARKVVKTNVEAMHGKPVKYLHVKRILQCTKMQELIYCGTYKFDGKKKKSVEW